MRLQYQSDALNIPKAVFLGHDWGGKFVWRMCLYHPERVIAVCGVCTPYIPPRREYMPLEMMAKYLPQFKYQLWLADSQNAGKSLDTSPERLFRALYRRPKDWFAYSNRLTLPEMIQNVDTGLEHPVFTDPSSVMTEEELQYYIAQYSHAKFASACQTYATTKIDYETELELPDMISHKALFIGAMQDSVLKPEMAAEMAKYMPNLTTAMVDDAGHWVLMEQKDKVNEILVEWMATIEAP
jgi:soluble epoxide hydrolase/lipid-phosphate phosphatase